MLCLFSNPGDFMKRYRRVLIVEDEPSLAQIIAETIKPFTEQIRICHSVHEAILKTEEWLPELVFLDYILPDGIGTDYLNHKPFQNLFPRIVAMSSKAGPANSFELALLGVSVYLEKPFGRQSLLDAVEKTESLGFDANPLYRNLVGKIGIQQAQKELRSAMVSQALAQSKGSRRGAAQLLKVSRQFIQNLLRRSSETDPETSDEG